MKREVEPLPTTSRPDARELLARFELLLRTRAVRLGLISDSDSDRLKERHVEDSLRAMACLNAEDRLLADLGSGAGLPGIPVAISQPARDVVLIEAAKRRAAFLEFVVEDLGLANVRVMASRAEDVELTADVCLARALAPPREAWELAAPLLRHGGRLLYFAGRGWRPDQMPPEAAWSGRVQPTLAICSKPRFAWEGPIVMMTASSQ